MLVVVIVVAAALVVMIVGMLVVVAVRMGMRVGMRVGMLMLMTVVMSMVVAMLVMVAVVAGLTGRMVVSAVMLGLGCLLGCEQRSHSLRAIVVGLGGEFVDGWQWLEAHGFQASCQCVSRLLSAWKLDEVGTSLQGNACCSQQTSGAKQGSSLLTGDDVEFDAVHGDGPLWGSGQREVGLNPP